MIEIVSQSPKLELPAEDFGIPPRQKYDPELLKVGLWVLAVGIALIVASVISANFWSNILTFPLGFAGGLGIFFSLPILITSLDTPDIDRQHNFRRALKKWQDESLIPYFNQRYGITIMLKDGQWLHHGGAVAKTSTGFIKVDLFGYTINDDEQKIIFINNGELDLIVDTSFQALPDA